MKILTIIGARPQFIKAAVVSKEFCKRKDIQEIIVHTGQHFDKKMSDVFFDQLQLPRPKYMLNINSLSHGAMTGRMMEEIEKIILIELPDYVMVYGDTNSTLAGSLAAKKLHIKVIHIEAGLRSFNIDMPEEINRILTDRISDILFCPTDTALINLQNEGFDRFHCAVYKTGDVMNDACSFFKDFAIKPDIYLPSSFALATIHRAENTDHASSLKDLFKALCKISCDVPIIIPLHPRTAKYIKTIKEELDVSNIVFIEPVSYLEMLFLLRECQFVLTDSGGLQKEAYMMGKYCFTLRSETEWVELVDAGVNQIVGNSYGAIISAYDRQKSNISAGNFKQELYGDGHACSQIVKMIFECQKI